MKCGKFLTVEFGHVHKLIFRSPLKNNKFAEALAEAEKLPSLSMLNSEVLSQLARLAVNSGAEVRAAQFLKLAEPGLRSKESLERAINVAWTIEDTSQAERIASRIRSSFPGSKTLAKYRLLDALKRRDYSIAAEAARNIENGDVEAEAYDFLVRHLTDNKAPDYPSIGRNIQSLPIASRVFASKELVQCALGAGAIADALTIVEEIPESEKKERANVLTALDVLGHAAMTRRPTTDGWGVEPDRLKTCFEPIIGYLSHHPSDAYLRGRLKRVLSVEGSGSFGQVAILYYLSKRFLTHDVEMNSNAPDKGIPLNQVFSDPKYFTMPMTWLDENGPAIFEKIRLPDELIRFDPRAMLQSIGNAISKYEGRVLETEEIAAILNFMVLGAAIAPHAKGTLQDLRVANMAAAVFARAGKVQKARDVCEQIALSAGSEPRRCRLAWATRAEVYHATNDKLESIIAGACALSIDVDVDPQDAWAEANFLTKLFRDNKIFELAYMAYELSDSIIGSLNVDKKLHAQHRHLGLSIRLMDVMRDPSKRTDELSVLVRDVAELANEMLRHSGNLGSITATLSQLVGVADTFKVPVSEEVRRLVKELQRSDDAQDPLVSAISAAVPTASDLLAVHLRHEHARYSRDLAGEAEVVAVLAKRFLSAANEATDSAELIFAIELLSDRAIAPPGWTTSSPPVERFQEIGAAAEVAKEISKTGFSLIIATVNRHESLLRIDVENGVISPIRLVSRNLFSGEVLKTWKKKYPYGYTARDVHANVFFLTTDGMAFDALPPSPILVVSSTDLQALPLNLWRTPENFAGLSRAMATIPSLSWMRAAQAYPDVPDRRKVAWISEGSEQGHTFLVAADMLEETLVEHDVLLNKNPSIPSKFVGAGLAIIVAHGGIAPGGTSFFTNISDEGEISVNASELVRALRNVDVVVLFVCSGGRVDKSPIGETTSGLAKQLLDAGCSAVLGSPWPLEVNVMWNWLPTFLDTWRNGANLAVANYEANRELDNRFPGDFKKSFAMHLIGNPFISYKTGKSIPDSQ